MAVHCNSRYSTKYEVSKSCATNLCGVDRAGPKNYIFSLCWLSSFFLSSFLFFLPIKFCRSHGEKKRP